jgi:hypothetical protein
VASSEAPPPVLPQLRYLYHIRVSERSGDSPQVFPLVVLLHVADAYVLSARLPEVLAEIVAVLKHRGADILPRLTASGVLGQPGDAANGPQVLLYHGELTVVSFSTDTDESAFRYGVLVRRGSPAAPAAPGAVLQGELFDAPSVTPWSLVASVQLKTAYVTRKRAAAVAADPGLSRFLPAAASAAEGHMGRSDSE